jgi:hypothetical protein
VSSWQVAAIVGLGALHGVNPAMGWLLSVYAGLKEASQRALLRTVPPIALGHALSIAVVLVALEAGSHAISQAPLRIACGTAVAIFALYKLRAARSHPRWVGLRLRPHELVGWSFLMSSAHGAGLMLVPILASGAAAHGALGASVDVVAGAAVLHTVAMLAVMTAISLLVYRFFGLGRLRTAWVNVDRVWAGFLLAAGAVTIVVG